MDNFIDTTNIEGRFEYSAFVRAYGKYLDEQLAVVAQCGWYQARPRTHGDTGFTRPRAVQASLSQQGSTARVAGTSAPQTWQLQVPQALGCGRHLSDRARESSSMPCF
jgi:hypothetical protein